MTNYYISFESEMGRDYGSICTCLNSTARTIGEPKLINFNQGFRNVGGKINARA